MSLWQTSIFKIKMYNTLFSPQKNKIIVQVEYPYLKCLGQEVF